MKLRHEAEALQRQTERGEAERSRRASEALQRAECVRQRRLLKVSAVYNTCPGDLEVEQELCSLCLHSS